MLVSRPFHCEEAQLCWPTSNSVTAQLSLIFHIIMVFSLILQLPSPLPKGWTEMSHPSMNKVLSCNNSSKKRKRKQKRKKPPTTMMKLRQWKCSLNCTFPWTSATFSSQRPSCWVILLSLQFGWGRKKEISPAMTWILASRMRTKSDKVETKIIPSEGNLFSGLLVPSAVQFWKARMGNFNISLRGFVYSSNICWVYPLRQAM